jgi:hypothetical protein
MGLPWRALCREVSISRQTIQLLLLGVREGEGEGVRVDEGERERVCERGEERHDVSYPRCIYTERNVISIL